MTDLPLVIPPRSTADSIIERTASMPQPVQFNCLNGPCQGAKVDAPGNATPGTACALPWKTVKGETRYAVYILVDHNGSQGLMFMQSYHRPEYAQSKVQRLTAICASVMS